MANSLMKPTVSASDPYTLYHHLLVLFCEEGGNILAGHKSQPAEITQLLTEAAQRLKFKGAAGKDLLIAATGKPKTPQILLVGIGKAAELDADVLRNAGAQAARQARRVGAERVGLVFPARTLAKGGAEGAARALGEGFLLGLYSFRKFKTGEEPTDAGSKVRELFAYPATGSAKEKAGWQQALALAASLARAVNLARDLSNAPANEMTPSKMAEEAQRIARLGGISCKILGREEMRKERMGGVLAVSQGTDTPPKFIVLEYKGAKKKSDPPVVVVGKGITFDTGGISLKPAAGMEEMKHDMSGAAAVIGLFDVLRDLKPKVNVIGLAPCTENMPSGKAYRPGDVVVTRSGKTVEILNTDAEGRMILCDALDYAKKYEPKCIIDLATLTGACVIALGHAAAGLMTNNENLKNALVAAADASGDRAWPLPLYKEYSEAVKSEIADLKNTGGRDAGALTGGAFLKEFVDKKTPWVHLDIAGTAWLTKPSGYFGKGATGYGVRLLAEYLKSVSK
ncbi:MAG: leucyl aminopeptidase [Bdellovibrionota bacterium]